MFNNVIWFITIESLTNLDNDVSNIVFSSAPGVGPAALGSGASAL